MDDIDSMIYPRSIKKELAKGQSLSEPKTVTTRAKAGSKRKRPSEPEEDNFEVERQIHKFITEVRILDPSKDKSLAEVEENLAGLRSIDAAKDKTISKLEKDVKGVEKQILVAEMQANKAEMEATDKAKAMDPSFDMSAWDVAACKQTLLQLGGEAESEQVQAVEVGPSEAKEVTGDEAGGDGVGGVEIAIVGDDRC
ncbi:hypothetical protein Hanom_Chr13g01199711 [Helianthus anomalus]